MPSFKPTLFIGLGTTGAEALCKLQRYIYDQYQRDDIPVIKLLSIITDVNDQNVVAERPGVLYKRININNTQQFHTRIDHPENNRDRALKLWLKEQWIPPEVTVEHGAGKKRSIGWLYLWDNETQRNLLNFIGGEAMSATSLNARQTTDRIINKQIHNAYGDPPETFLEPDMDIFVIGSLAGGSCSGLSPYFGYYLKQIPGVRTALGDTGKITGVFTVLDSGQAANQAYHVLAENAHGALRELEYFSTKDILTHYTPDGERILLEENPYNRIYILSPTNMRGNTLVKEEQGGRIVDHDSVLEMIALSLFMDVSLGLGPVRNALAVDGIAGVAPQGESVGELDKYAWRPRCFYSFGARAFIHPWNFLTRAAACRHATAFIQRQYKRDENEETRVVDYFRARINAIFDREFLRIPDKNATIDGEIKNHCDIAERQSAPGQRPDLKDFPGAIVEDLPFKERLDGQGTHEAGRWMNIISYNAKRIDTLVENAISEFIKKLRTRPVKFQISVLDAILKKFEEAKQKLENIGGEPYDLDLHFKNELDRLAASSSNVWMLLVFLKGTAMQQLWEALCEEICTYTIRSVKERTVHYRLKIINKIVEKILKEKDRVLTLLEELRTYKRLINEEHSKIHERLNSPPQCIKYVYKSVPQNVAGRMDSIEYEINDMVMHSTDANGHVRGIADHEILEDIIQVENHFRPNMSEVIKSRKRIEAVTQKPLRVVESSTGRTDVVTLLDDQWDATDTGHVSYAAPHMEFTGNYEAMGYRIDPPPGCVRQAIFGPNGVEVLQAHLAGDQPWTFKISETALVSQIICYCEEIGFSTSFLETFRYLRQHSSETTWTDQRWGAFGPDLDKKWRKKFIKYILECSWEMTNNTCKCLWRSLEPPIYIMPAGGEYGRIDVQLYVDQDYERVAENGQGKFFVNFLKLDLRDCLQQNYTVESWAQAHDTYRTSLARKRTAALNEALPAQQDAIVDKYEKIQTRMTMFYQYCRKMAWRIDYDHVENLLLEHDEYRFLVIIGTEIQDPELARIIIDLIRNNRNV